MRIPFIFRLVFNRYFFQKLFAIVLLGVLIYSLRDFLLIFLIAFLFAYLFLDLAKFIHARLQDFWGKKKLTGCKRFLCRMLSLNAIVTLVYLSFVALVIFLVSSLVPKLLEEGKGLIKETPVIVDQIRHAASNIEGMANMDLGINQALSNVLSKESGNIEEIVQNTFENLKNIGIFLVKFLIALVLSYIFIVDRERISGYLSDLKHGNFSFLYEEYRVIFQKINKGFGLVFKAQALIALVNALLTVAGLLLISIVHGGTFPFIITLGLIVFIFGFIPVLGIFLSSAPILIIGYNYGGWTVVMAILVMIAIIHSIEAYYLNPKIVSSYMEFPVFLTFVILLVSEHFFGFIGLLVGVPLFYILVDVLKDTDHFITKIRHASETLHETQKQTKTTIDSEIRLSRSGKKNI